MNYEIRTINKDDITAVLSIEKECFKSPWNFEQFVSEIENNIFASINVLVLEENGKQNVIGYYDVWITFDTSTIAKIAVLPSYQRHHFGSAMMQEIIEDCYAKRVRSITLEVRKGNEKARKFYAKFGFKEITIKPHYYDDGEDAIYMIKEVNLNG